MTRGTTPTYYFYLEDVDLSETNYLEVTFRQDSTMVTKYLEDCVIDEVEQSVACELTQEETLMFKPSHRSGRVKVDIRGLNNDAAWATDKYEEEVLDVNREGVIPRA